MYNQIRPVSTQPESSRIDQAMNQGIKWMEQATYNAASRMLPKMDDGKQASVWGALKNDPHALQSYITHLGRRQGITDAAGLDKLAQEYITTQSGRFGE